MSKEMTREEIIEDLQDTITENAHEQCMELFAEFIKNNPKDANMTYEHWLECTLITTVIQHEYTKEAFDELQRICALSGLFKDEG